MVAPTLSFENEVFAKFAFYAGVVLLKTVIMSGWTARYRLPRGVFISSEDYVGRSGQTMKIDEDVERTRRCHLNDIENVLPFVLIGLLYVLTGPTVASATLHFRLFAGFRLFHTIAYMFILPQPSRAIAFFVGFGVNISMAITVIRAGMF
ncbi:microsomal glutathione S-transferase 1-like [Ruditapes philippinarum]|uniref:Microsomal glutathione S-transferase 1 n=1 Tax=Ruditapes philippinarum TaxID=129788 RepID=C8CBM6_RUDPH|nr:microsomal glutathione S-transferase 1-like [Ruditapes philippinarum]ACU83223.1 microsomal glutathione S-transferase [Ruditapes philippinarum]